MTQHSPDPADRLDENELSGLETALRAMFGAEASITGCQTQPLKGGTVGQVRLITGQADSAAAGRRPFSLVQKTQQKWERPGDPDSWRREYDLYRSGLSDLFDDTLCWPNCLYADMNDDQDQTRIWMEYIEGPAGYALTPDMLERAAHALGRFQGRLYAGQPDILGRLTNLSDITLMKNRWQNIRSWQQLRDYIRSDGSGLPAHLRHMLTEAEANAEAIWRRIDRLPVVLCHRDFWVTNIFSAGGSTVLIDWDTAGWGRMGEDIASLIADEADVRQMPEYYRRCVPAYYRGFSEYADVSHITDHCIRDMMLMNFGFRLAAWHMTAETAESKVLQADTLQMIYEIYTGP